METAYRFKNIVLEQDENGYPCIRIKLVERFVDGKHDKFIPMHKAIDIIKQAVVYEKDFNTICSKAEKKRQKKQQYKQQHNKNKQQLVESILLSMD